MDLCKAGLLKGSECTDSECIKMGKSVCCGLCAERDKYCCVCPQLNEPKILQ